MTEPCRGSGREEVVERIAFDANIGEQPRREVTLAAGRDDHYDLLALVFGPLRHLDSRPDCRTGRYSDWNSIQLIHLLADRAGFRLFDPDHFVVNFRVQNRGDESCTESLQLVRARLAAGKHR